MMRIDWSARAKQDLRNLKAYIGCGSLFYAKRFVLKILQNVENLSSFPEMGRHVPEACEQKNIRELIIQGYRVIYLVEVNAIYILAIVHGNQDLDGMDNKPWKNPSSFDN